MPTLTTPTDQVIDSYINKFYKDERYYLADQAIINLFEKFPENKSLEDILLKISVINDLYSTNIYGTFILARHIQKLGIDESIRNGDPAIVNKIATGHGISNPTRTGDRNFYSFATKYCNWHNKDAYPIYDSYVHKILVAYRNKDGFSNFGNADLKDYRQLKKIIGDFKKQYGLIKHNLKEIDKFLWMYGQEMFPNAYKKKTNKAATSTA